MKHVESLFVHISDTVHRVVEKLQRGAVGVVLVVDDELHLIATVTDGDIRRGLLNNIGMEESIALLLKTRPAQYRVPMVAKVDSPKDELLRLMQERQIRQVPLLDEEDHVVELALLSELIQEKRTRFSAVVMAGGFGKRLRPLTDDTPKPMLLLNGRPLMERTIEQLQKAGVEQVFITTHYKSEVITEHFQDGRDFGTQIQYVNEIQPMGTAGALGLMERHNHTSIVINGDILTQLDFQAMLNFHHDHDAIMTVGMRNYGLQVPYGVVEMDGVKINSLKEKPEYTFLVNAGIYLLEPEAYNYIPKNTPSDMTDLINLLLSKKKTVIGFPIQEYWLDIGQIDDYQRAIEKVENNE
jgi:dTDP-glucose pyrophosphorylase/CBS domain-containing protein